MNNELKLKVQMTSFGMIGYGYVYAGEILEVLEGNFDEKNISIVIMNDDHVVNTFAASLPKIAIVSFTKGEDNVKYRTMPINGFVDENHTSWLIKDVKLIEN